MLSRKSIPFDIVQQIDFLLYNVELTMSHAVRVLRSLPHRMDAAANDRNHPTLWRRLCLDYLKPLLKN